MLLAGCKRATTAAASNSAYPTRSLEHLQQIWFSTKAADVLRTHSPVAASASAAREAQELIVKAWTAKKDNSKASPVNHRQNLRSCIARRSADHAFSRPAMMSEDGLVLVRAAQPRVLTAAIADLRALR